MANLQTLESVVLSILEQSTAARKDDYVLFWLVCEKIKPEIVEKPFADVLYNHIAWGLPNWESVTRCRRKIQAKRPDLVDKNAERKRRKEEKEYRAYALT